MRQHGCVVRLLTGPLRRQVVNSWRFWVFLLSDRLSGVQTFLSPRMEYQLRAALQSGDAGLLTTQKLQPRCTLTAEAPCN